MENGKQAVKLRRVMGCELHEVDGQEPTGDLYLDPDLCGSSCGVAPGGTKLAMSEIERRFANFFLLRAVLSFVVLAFVFYHHQQSSPALWLLASVYLASNLVLRALPARRFENPALSFGVFFADIAVFTFIYYSTAGGSSWLIFFYLTILMATLGETVPKSVGIGFGISALYVWFLGQNGALLLNDQPALLPIPLFLITA
jgi:hypothetical protein